ncbi:hypothetical protein LCGC14_3033660, partial [marine sediment metagenome]
LCDVSPWQVRAAASAAEDDAGLVLAKKAVVAVQTNLRSGSARGTFRQWGPNKQLIQSVRFTGVFDNAKERLELIYKPVVAPGITPDECSKRILICDGPDVFVSEFSNRIRPVGAQSHVYNNRPASVRNHTRGFPSGIRRMAGSLFDPEVVEKHEHTTEELPGGHFRCRFNLHADYYLVVEFAPECGHHAVLGKSFIRDQLSGTFIATWEKKAGQWYAKSRSYEHHIDGKLVKSYEVKFEQFEPNVPVSPKLFTLTALELPGGARIFDRRPPAGGARTFKAKVYKLTDGKGVLAPKRAKRLIEQVESLPRMY